MAAPPKVPFPILFRTTLTTVLHYRADCDGREWSSREQEWLNPLPVKSTMADGANWIGLQCGEYIYCTQVVVLYYSNTGKLSVSSYYFHF